MAITVRYSINNIDLKGIAQVAKSLKVIFL